MKTKYNDKKLDRNTLLHAMDDCRDILYSKKIVDIEVDSITREALFIYLIILLKAIIYSIDFIPKQEYSDLQNFDSIDDLVTFIRNASCHIESEKNYDLFNSFNRFNIFLGNDEYLKNYKDDAAIQFGDVYILYWRHIVFLFKEISEYIGYDFDGVKTLIKI